jgi:RNA polymerase sigma-70 factor (ECF subfamily)
VAASQKEVALTALHDRHGAELWRFALRLTHDRQAAEDVVQEVLLRAWKDPQLGERAEPAARAWLFTTTRNLVIDRWRSAAARHERAPSCRRTVRSRTRPASSWTGGWWPRRWPPCRPSTGR